MAETPAVQCPSCGSGAVVVVSLWLIPAKYYECPACKITFRRPVLPDEPPDLRRFDDGWRLPPDEPKK